MNLNQCDICPRHCGVNRTQEKGICSVKGSDAFLTRAALYYYEEPCISGTRGSGAVFFSGCNLHCIYCQNEAISHGQIGKYVSVERLSQIFLELQGKGANNINLVTPTHYAPQIREALLLARAKGLKVPIVYNCSGYESVETLKMLSGLIDVYLTDFKYSDRELAKELSHAEDYPEVAMEALREMMRQCPECVFTEQAENYGSPEKNSGDESKIESDERPYNGEYSGPIMTKGVIVRHLLLPGHVKNSEGVIGRIYEEFGDQLYFSIMNQYTPMRNFEKYPFLNRKVTKREYNRLINYCLDLGIENAFIQEGETQEKSFIPEFDYEGI